MCVLSVFLGAIDLMLAIMDWWCYHDEQVNMYVNALVCVHVSIPIYIYLVVCLCMYMPLV